MLWIFSSLLMGCGEETERVTFDNLPPFSPIVDLQPAVPYTNDDLEVLLVAESIDPNDDEVSMTYQWYKNDELQADLTEQTVPSVLTAVGDVWTISVIANDGTLDSADTRRSVTIRNSPPTLSASLQWVDAAGVVQEDIDAPTQDFELSDAGEFHLQVVSSVEDIDLDDITYTYEWSVGGTVVPSIEGDLLENDQLSHGQNWIVTVTANDGLTDSESIEIPFDFYNSPPVISEVTLDPEMPYFGDSVLCEASATDDEGDTIELTYVWTITTTNEDGDEEETESSDNPLDTSGLVEGDSILCRATADDGYDTSSMTTESILLVTNTNPTVSDVVFTSNEVDSTQVTPTFSTCSATVVDNESSFEDLVITYEWTDDTNTVLNSTDTIETTGMAVDDVLTCTVTASDGDLHASASGQITLIELN